MHERISNFLVEQYFDCLHDLFPHSHYKKQKKKPQKREVREKNPQPASIRAQDVMTSSKR